jgi:hypothetical protein
LSKEKNLFKEPNVPKTPPKDSEVDHSNWIDSETIKFVENCLESEEYDLSEYTLFSDCKSEFDALINYLKEKNLSKINHSYVENCKIVLDICRFNQLKFCNKFKTEIVINKNQIKEIGFENEFDFTDLELFLIPIDFLSNKNLISKHSLFSSVNFLLFGTSNYFEISKKVKEFSSTTISQKNDSITQTSQYFEYAEQIEDLSQIIYRSIIVYDEKKDILYQSDYNNNKSDFIYEKEETKKINLFFDFKNNKFSPILKITEVLEEDCLFLLN